MNKKIFEEIRHLKHQVLPNERLILFGSQARGDERPDSDWDMLILLNKPNTEYADFEKYAYPFVELGWTHGTYFSMKLYSNMEWEQGKIFPFHKNVEHDGIEIV